MDKSFAVVGQKVLTRVPYTMITRELEIVEASSDREVVKLSDGSWAHTYKLTPVGDARPAKHAHAVHLSRAEVSAVFTEWARRYAEDPSAFGDVVDANGCVIEGYGDRCAAYFFQVAQVTADMIALGQMPPTPEAA